MKKTVYLIMLAALALAVSCKKEDVAKYESTPKLTIVSSELEFSPAAAKGKVVVDTQSPITATTDREWCAPSVSGNTVYISVTDNANKQSRYALLKLKAGDAALDLTVIQYGEVVEGLAGLSDVTAQVNGEKIILPIKTNVPVTLETESSWIHPVFEGKELVITIDANTEPKTRFGTVTYTAGTAHGSFDVTQYPELKKNADWTLSMTEATYDYPKFLANTSVTASEADMYIITSLPKSEVEEKDLPDYIFSELAVKARRDILKKVEANPGTAFADYLLKGNSTPVIEDIPLGDSYLIVIGFAENGYVSGQYQYTTVTVEDIRPVFYKWTGKWKVHRENSKVNTDDIWTISVKEKDTKLMIQGIEGLSNSDGRYNVEATVDADGHLVLKTQNTLTYKDASYGDVTVLLSGQYDDTAEGKTYYTAKLDLTILSATLSADFNSATMEGGVASGSYHFKNIQFYGRYKKSGSSSWSAFSWTNGTTDIAQTITRVE